MTDPAASPDSPVLYLEDAVWAAAATLLSRSATAPDPVKAAAATYLRTVDLPMRNDSADLGQALARAAAAASSDGRWQDTDDQVLIDQGEHSARGADLLGPMILPRMTGLEDLLARPGARMLDIGTGIAALADSYARRYPTLHAVGLDVSKHVLGLARERLASSPARTRIELRHANVIDLEEDRSYDFVWLPAPFIPPADLEAALPRITAALRPGAWLLMAYDPPPTAPIPRARAALQTSISGGTELDHTHAHALLDSTQLVEVQQFPTPLGAPALIAGRRPQE